MLDNEELVMDAEVPDEYSEGSGNPDEDWDGGNDDDEDDTSKGVSQVKGGIEPGSAKFFGWHKEYMQCLTNIIGVTTAQGINILETQGIDFEALKLLIDSNVKTLFDDKALKGVPLIKRMRFVALRNWAYSTLHARPDLFDQTKVATVMARIAASSKKAPPSIKPTEPPTFSAERKDWPKWKKMSIFTSTLLGGLSAVAGTTTTSSPTIGPAFIDEEQEASHKPSMLQDTLSQSELPYTGGFNIICSCWFPPIKFS
jgi:hypothetical protein